MSDIADTISFARQCGAVGVTVTPMGAEAFFPASFGACYAEQAISFRLPLCQLGKLGSLRKLSRSVDADMHIGFTGRIYIHFYAPEHRKEFMMALLKVELPDSNLRYHNPSPYTSADFS